MNAGDQARSLEFVRLIAAIAALFRQHFPDARPNLRPWRDDPQTRAFEDQHTLDLSFHLPGWSPRSQCRSFFVQLSLFEGVTEAKPRLLGVTIRGLTYESERWRLTTLGDWLPGGTHPPVESVTLKLKRFCAELFDLFEAGASEADVA